MSLIMSQIQGEPVPHEASMLVEVKSVKAVLNWKDKSPPEVSTNCKYKVEELTDNSYFPLPWPTLIVTLVQFGALIVALDKAITATESKTKGSAALLRKALRNIKVAAQSIMSMVQITMNNNIGLAVEICEGAGFEYYISKGGSTRENRVRKSTIPGVLYIELGGGGQHEFQISTDGGITATHLGVSTSGSYTAQNLISKKEYWFRGREVLTKGRFAEWTAWYSQTAP